MEPVSRRAIFAGACGIAALTVTGLPAASANAVTKLSGGRLSVNVKALPALKEVGGSLRVGMVKGQSVALTRTGPSSFIAFALVCPHQLKPVVKSETGWVCNEHGSRFEPDGDLEYGPATTRLPRLKSRVSGGRVIIG
jgi:Rieske Fe-S protein